jgi:hypothetical protein
VRFVEDMLHESLSEESKEVINFIKDKPIINHNDLYAILITGLLQNRTKTDLFTLESLSLLEEYECRFGIGKVFARLSYVYGLGY